MSLKPFDQASEAVLIYTKGSVAGQTGIFVRLSLNNEAFASLEWPRGSRPDSNATSLHPVIARVDEPQQLPSPTVKMLVTKPTYDTRNHVDSRLYKDAKSDPPADGARHIDQNRWSVAREMGNCKAFFPLSEQET